MDYQTFIYESDRFELVQFSARLSLYLRANDVHHLIVVDRSSRPVWVGLKAILDVEGYDLKIHFVNPMGFIAEGAHYADKVQYQQTRKGNLADGSPRPQHEIDTEVQLLGLPTDETVAVFDTCIHSGHSVKPLLRTLDGLGYQTELVTVSPSECRTLREDFHLTSHRPSGGCYPWGRDSLVSKTFRSIFSSVEPDPIRRAQSRQIRREARHIITTAIKEATNA